MVAGSSNHQINPSAFSVLSWISRRFFKGPEGTELQLSTTVSRFTCSLPFFNHSPNPSKGAHGLGAPTEVQETTHPLVSASCFDPLYSLVAALEGNQLKTTLNQIKSSFSPILELRPDSKLGSKYTGEGEKREAWLWQRGSTLSLDQAVSEMWQCLELDVSEMRSK